MKLQGPRRRRVPDLVAALTAVLFLVAACGGQPQADPVTVTVRMGEAPGGYYYFAQDDAEPVDARVEAVNITAPGDAPIVFELVNEGALLHTFTIDALGMNVEVAPGATVTTQARTIAAGTYQVYCAVAGHRALGQQASLVVGGS